MEFKPHCDLVDQSRSFRDVEVLRIHYDVTSVDQLTIDLESSSHGDFQLVFDSPEAVRVLDEGQVCEFWDTYSTPNGWLWLVRSGGWLALESQRDGFYLPDVMPTQLYEYLVVGDQCVFVLTRSPPNFHVMHSPDGPVA